MSRSQSRGRENEYGSSGRGGAGNIRPQSRDPIHRHQDADDRSPTRGRELRNTSDEHDEPITHSGRGGAGNIRPLSRDPEADRRGYEADRKLVKDYDTSQHIHSAGRGGVGNIDRSRSRSRARDAPHNNKGLHGGVIGNIIGRISRDHSRDRSHPSTEHHTTGRGGYGNMYDGPPNVSKVEEERNTYKKSADDGGAHPAARGGYGNGNTSSAVGTGTGGYDTQAPHPATDEHHTYASGRGGAGNIHSDY